jgi:hypothetical protein
MLSSITTDEDSHAATGVGAQYTNGEGLADVSLGRALGYRIVQGPTKSNLYRTDYLPEQNHHCLVSRLRG